MPLAALRQQLARVHDPSRVQALLDRAQGIEAELADLRSHVGYVVAADSVVVGDGSASLDDRLRCGRLRGAPLLELRGRSAGGDEGAVERRPVRVRVREVT